MEKSRFLAILMLGLACLFLIACQTAGTPKQSDGTPINSRATGGAQTPPPAKSASQTRTARYSGKVGSTTSARLKDPPGKAVNRLGILSSAVVDQPIQRMRTILYAALVIIFLVVMGAITAERVGRHRKLTPASLNARH
jgi:hypothetical protein